MDNLITESSKITQHTITALNSVPVLLALVLLQFFILGSIMYLNLRRDETNHLRFMALIERCVVGKTSVAMCLRPPASCPE